MTLSCTALRSDPMPRLGARSSFLHSITSLGLGAGFGGDSRTLPVPPMACLHVLLGQNYGIDVISVHHAEEAATEDP